MKVVQVNFACDNQLQDPDALLDRYRTLTGWSEALADAGASVTTVQRFHRPARVTRNGIEYVFADRDLLRPDIVHVNGLVFPVRTWRLRRALHASAAIVVQNHSDGTDVGRAPLFRLLGRVTRGAVDAFLFASPITRRRGGAPASSRRNRPRIWSWKPAPRCVRRRAMPRASTRLCVARQRFSGSGG